MQVASPPRRVAVERAGPTVERARPRRFLRWAAPVVYVALLSAFMWRDGVPAARDRLLMWIVIGLLALSTANLGGWMRGVVLEWLPFALVLSIYDLLRGLADGLLFTAYFRPQIEADRLLFAGNVPTAWLQQQLWHGSSQLRWYDYAAWGVYMSYFVATYLVAGLLWFFARARFRRYVATISLLAATGFVTFALVYTAEHYVVDILLGWAYALAAVWVVHRLADVLARHRTLRWSGSRRDLALAARPSAEHRG